MSDFPIFAYDELMQETCKNGGNAVKAWDDIIAPTASWRPQWRGWALKDAMIESVLETIAKSAQMDGFRRGWEERMKAKHIWLKTNDGGKIFIGSCDMPYPVKLRRIEAAAMRAKENHSGVAGVVME